MSESSRIVIELVVPNLFQVLANLYQFFEPFLHFYGVWFLFSFIPLWIVGWYFTEVDERNEDIPAVLGVLSSPSLLLTYTGLHFLRERSLSEDKYERLQEKAEQLDELYEVEEDG